MKQSMLAASLFVSASLVTATTYSQNLEKDASLQAYIWNGYYAGLNLGAVKHTMNMTDTQAATFNATIQQVSNPEFTGGFQFGYRKQLTPSQTTGVFGVEFSANFSDDQFNSQYGSPFALYQLSAVNNLKNVLLLEAIGGIAADKTLLFLAAGLAWTNISGHVNNLDGVPFFNSFNVGKTALGTTIGAGIEYGYNEKFSTRLKVDVISSNAYSTLDNVGNSYQISNNIVQATFAVNYKFGQF